MSRDPEPRRPGRPPIGNRLDVALPAEVRARLETEAAQRGLKVRELARTLIEAGLDRLPPGVSTPPSE